MMDHYDISALLVQGNATLEACIRMRLAKLDIRYLGRECKRMQEQVDCYKGELAEFLQHDEATLRQMSLENFTNQACKARTNAIKGYKLVHNANCLLDEITAWAAPDIFIDVKLGLQKTTNDIAKGSGGDNWNVTKLGWIEYRKAAIAGFAGDITYYERALEKAIERYETAKLYAREYRKILAKIERKKKKLGNQKK